MWRHGGAVRARPDPMFRGDPRTLPRPAAGGAAQGYRKTRDDGADASSPAPAAAPPDRGRHSAAGPIGRRFWNNAAMAATAAAGLGVFRL